MLKSIVLFLCINPKDSVSIRYFFFFPVNAVIASYLNGYCKGFNEGFIGFRRIPQNFKNLFIIKFVNFNLF